MNIKFLFILNDYIPSEPAYVANTGKYIDGSLNIYLNDTLYFHDPNINLTEFASQLSEWVQKIRNGLKVNMNYESINRNEDLMNFLYKDDDRWGIYSVWQMFEPTEYITTESLVESVNKFLTELNNSLIEINYDYTLDKFNQ
ncbi:hypothetical protein [Bacillus sp. AFS041924]|uniref:DUF7878 domain-containing protein n=1 Tax=Bacillus sp. AFS041924 TaxID=2033503 RepID=UPI000BFCBA42|nr:hypothetical protein [Bacillus sp. AFS041924]PGS48367.1 hypothetical protein COC46_18375 [Bacillus sp. AFS041924]